MSERRRSSPVLNRSEHMLARHTRKLLLALSFLLFQAIFASVIAQAEDATETSDPIYIPGQFALEDVRETLERLMVASDKGDRAAFARFKRFYTSLYNSDLIESSSEDLPKTAKPIVLEIDRFVSDRAAQGSATAQYWLGAREMVPNLTQDRVPNPPAAARWFRMSAEQRFAPAESELRLLLTYFIDEAREPFEGEKWLLRAVRQGEAAAAKWLIEVVDRDLREPNYRPNAEVLAWLQQQAGDGNSKAKDLLARLAARS
jgi:TPR repeat protein